MSGLRDIKIGDTVTICGHPMKLVRVEGLSIVYQIIDKNGKPNSPLQSYGLRAFQMICRNYGLNFIP